MRTGIALGANLGERLVTLTRARDAIFSLSGVSPPLLSSSVYETEPVECEQGAEKFLNAVIEVGYESDPLGLLRELQRLENQLGRPANHAANRSRAIDIDLLYHGARTLDQNGLQLPHPRLHLRGFVLHPLAEIRPNLVLPGQARTVRELSDEIAAAPSVVRAARQW